MFHSDPTGLEARQKTRDESFQIRLLDPWVKYRASDEAPFIDQFACHRRVKEINDIRGHVRSDKAQEPAAKLDEVTGRVTKRRG
jgi:hypothetical protein